MATKRKFVDAWLTEPNFKKWLKKGTDGKPYCIPCSATIASLKSSLIDHAATEKHKKSCDKEAVVKKSFTLESLGYSTPEVTSIKKIELSLAAFIAEHCPIHTIDHLSELLKSLFPTVSACQQLKLHRTKCTRLISKVLAPCLQAEIVDDIKSSYYSVLIDESTDIGTCKMLCLVIRYFSKKQKKIATTFYRLICIEKGDAETISQHIIQCLKEDGLEIYKLIGIGTDNVAVMVGVNSSVYTKLKEHQPNLILVKCICHSLALAASKAVEKLPTHLDYIIQQTHLWFSHSSKRQGRYAEIYKLLNNDQSPLKILKFCTTRWLSRYECIDRILNNWDELKLYFADACASERSYLVNELANMYNVNTNRAYLLFLKSILKPVSIVNQQFQAAAANPLCLIDSLASLYEKILQKIVLPAYFSRVTTQSMASFHFQQHLRRPELMDLPYEFNACFALTVNNPGSLISSDKKPAVVNRCFEFMVELASQIKQRLPESIDALNLIRAFEPNIVLAVEETNIRQLLHTFFNIEVDVESAVSEYNILRKREWSTAARNDPTTFWLEVYETNGKSPDYPLFNICTFALAMLSLPLSNAAVERVFSMMSIVKNKLRNRLQAKMVEAILIVRSALVWRGETCKNFSVTNNMLQKFNMQMYKEDCGDDADVELDDVDSAFNVLDGIGLVDMV